MSRLFTCLIALLCLSACRSEFEKVREGGEPQEILEKGHEYFDKEEYLKANSLYEIVLSQYRGQKEAEQLYFNYSYTFYHMRQYISAAYSFENFAKTYGNSDLREEAEFMVGMSHYQLSPTFRLEQTYSEKAIASFQRFANFFPNSSRVEECNALIDELRRKLEQKAFDSAELYYNIGNYKAALHSFQNVLSDFPDSPQRENIRYLAVKAAYELADNSYYEKKKERFENVIELYDEFVKRHEKSTLKKELQLLRDKSINQIKSLNNV